MGRGTAAAERPVTVRGGVSSLPAWRFALLLAAALAVSMSYGVTLPLLPALVERLGGGTPADVARHTGWLTGLYTLGLFAFSPAWGALSDRIDRRAVIALGLGGSGVALWGLDFAPTLAALYVARAVAGVLSAAVLPAVFAQVVEMTVPGHRQRRFAWVASATALGFLLGPVVGHALGSLAGDTGPAMAASPFGAVAAACFAAAIGTALLSRGQGPARDAPGCDVVDEVRVRQALALTALVVLGITVAEVGLTLIGRAGTVVRAADIARYFALCSVVMVAVQMGLYPVLERRWGEPRLVAAALASLAVGVALLAWPVARWVPALAFVLGASGIGVLIPALAVRISMAAGPRQGWALGRQSSAANLGQALGAASTGVLYAQGPVLPFLIAAAAIGLCALWAAWVARSARTRR